MTTGWDRARAVADAVLYEGYLLYPYRATSGKNQSRWQFGVLGPSGAAEAGIGEDDTMSAQFVVDGDAELNLVIRFLQLQHRQVEHRTGGGGFEPVDELTSGTQIWVTWDEAVFPYRFDAPDERNELDKALELPPHLSSGSSNHNTVPNFVLWRHRRKFWGCVANPQTETRP